jgi:CubicO group peptidase (beta-lactamase class C family)
MRKYMKTWIIIGGILLVSLVVALVWTLLQAPPRKPRSIPTGDYSYTIAYSEHRIRQLMEQRHWPSLSVALIDDQETIYQNAFGWADIEAEIPARPATVYKLWSVAKVFTAIETMRLAEDGLLDLDEPITNYLPEYSIHSRFPGSATPTARDILSHRSGLPRNGCHHISDKPGSPLVLGGWQAGCPGL